MQYSNFVMKNNIHATLSTALSSIATTIQLTTGQWTRFWTEFPQIATLESFDDTWKVVKREIVQITARNDDNLTVVRAFAPCPANDDANSQSQSAISFNADDTISLYIPKEIFDKIHDSLNDIYDNGTNNLRTEFVSWLDVEVNAWPVLVWSAYYDFAGWTITLTDNATNYLEIDENWLLANNTSGRNDENTKLAIITTSGGSVTNIKDRRLWTVGWKIGWINIHELTKKNLLVNNDEFVISDSENIWNNKKISASDITDFMTVSTCILLVWWWGWWNKGNWYVWGWWWGGWQVVFDNDFIIRRWKHYKIHIWCGWWADTDWWASVFDCCVALWWWWAGRCWWNWWWSNTTGCPEWYIADYSIFAYWWYHWWSVGWSQYVWGSWWWWWACGNWGNGWWNSNCWIWWDWWCWFCSDIDWTSKAYWWGWWWWRRYYCAWSHAGTVNWWWAWWNTNWWNATVYWWWGGWWNSSSWTWWCWCQWVFIIKYPKSCWLCITWAQCSYECNNNCIHIVTQNSIICAK